LEINYIKKGETEREINEQSNKKTKKQGKIGVKLFLKLFLLKPLKYNSYQKQHTLLLVIILETLQILH